MTILDLGITLKTALRRLTQATAPKAEDIEVVQQLALGVDAAMWRKAFEAEGTLKAQELNFRTPQLSRLMAAQAVLVPDSLPEFVQWLRKSPTAEREALRAWLAIYSEVALKALDCCQWLAIAKVADQSLSVAEFASLVLLWGEGFKTSFERWCAETTPPHSCLQPLWRYRTQPTADPSYAPLRKALQQAAIAELQPVLAVVMQIEQGQVSPVVFDAAFPEAKTVTNRVRYLGIMIVTTARRLTMA